MTTPGAPAPAVVHRVTSPPAGAMGGLALPTSGPSPLAALHFSAAVIFLVAGTAGLIWVAPELAAGMYPSPHVAGITHFFTLGWLTTTIFGALFQLLPVALGTPVRWPRVGYASFWTFAPGVALFATGVAAQNTVLHHAGIALLATGILLAVTNFGATLVRVRTRTVTWAAITIALTFLASTLVLGIVLLHNLHTGFLADARVRVLAIHLHVAMIGFVLTMIVGVSHRLLPMFLLAHGADERWSRRALTLVPPGVVALATGLAIDSLWVTWLGAALLEAGFACFVLQAKAFHRARVRRRIDVGMKFAATGIGFLIAAAVLGPALLAAGSAHRRLATLYVIAGLLGGLVMYVTGFFYKIVPLLAWMTVYRGRMGKESVPTVADTYSARLAHVQLVLSAVGITIVGAGTVAGHSHCVRIGALLFASGVLLFTWQMGRLATGGRP